MYGLYLLDKDLLVVNAIQPSCNLNPACHFVSIDTQGTIEWWRTVALYRKPRNKDWWPAYCWGTMHTLINADWYQQDVASETGESGSFLYVMFQARQWGLDGISSPRNLFQFEAQPRTGTNCKDLKSRPVRIGVLGTTSNTH